MHCAIILTMPAKYDQEVFFTVEEAVADKYNDLFIRSGHAQKGVVEGDNYQFINYIPEGDNEEAKRILATVTNRSRIYIKAHSISGTVMHIKTSTLKGVVLITTLVEFLGSALTHDSLKDARSDRRLRISLIICLSGLGKKEHRLSAHERLYKPDENFEESFAVMLCASLHGAKGIYSDVVGRRDYSITTTPAPEAIGHIGPPTLTNERLSQWIKNMTKKGELAKTYALTKELGVKTLKSGSLKFIVTVNSVGKLVYYDEYKDFLYSLTKHDIIPELKAHAKDIFTHNGAETDAFKSIMDCVSVLSTKAQTCLSNQIASGEGEERPSAELERLANGHETVTKLSVAPPTLRADCIEVLGMLTATKATMPVAPPDDAGSDSDDEFGICAVATDPSVYTMILFETLIKKVKDFAATNGIQDLPP